MKGIVSDELDVALPASKLWGVYGTIRMFELIVKLLPEAASKIEIEKGDGGVGTIIRVIFPPGAPGASYQREKFLKVDNEHRVKVVAVIEGGMLESGFLSYTNCFEIIKHADNLSTIKSSIEYEVDKEHEAAAALVTTDSVANLAKTISRYLLENENKRLKVMRSNLCFDFKLWIRRLFRVKASGVRISDAM